MSDWINGSRGYCRINGFVTRVKVIECYGAERRVQPLGEEPFWVSVTELSTSPAGVAA